MPDFANASSVQGLGEMVKDWADNIEARVAKLEGYETSVDTSVKSPSLDVETSAPDLSADVPVDPTPEEPAN